MGTIDDRLVDIQQEVEKLNRKEYRASEKMWASDKQIVFLRKMISKVRAREKGAEDDLLRLVADTSSLNSRLFVMTNELVEAMKNKGPN